MNGQHGEPCDDVDAHRRSGSLRGLFGHRVPRLTAFFSPLSTWNDCNVGTDTEQSRGESR